MRQLRLRMRRKVLRVLGGVTREEFDRSIGSVWHQLEHVIRGQSETTAWLTSQGTQLPAVRPGDGASPLVSVIMPVRNRADILTRAIESVLAQTWLNWELLVADDGSTDGSPELLARLARRDARIRLLIRPHEGVCRTRNAAMAVSRGRYLAYLDSDNYWYPGHLSEAVTALEQNANHSAVYLAQHVHNAAARLDYIRGRTFDRAYFASSGGIDLNAYVHARTLYEQHGGFDPRLTRLVDWELIGRYSADCDPLFVPVVTGFYEEARPDSISVREDFESNASLARSAATAEAASPPTIGMPGTQAADCNSTPGASPKHSVRKSDHTAPPSHSARVA